MDTRASPKGSGEKEGSRWIEGPTATSSQPETQPQMAHLYDSGDVPSAQSTADAESVSFLCNLCMGENPPSMESAPTVSGIVHHCDRLCLRPTFPELIGSAQRSGNRSYAAVPFELGQGPLDIPHDGQLSLPLDPIWPTPVAHLPTASRGQPPKELTFQPTDVEEKRSLKRSGDGPSGIGVIRVFSNPGPDGEDRLRRVFALMVKYATNYRQDGSGEDSPADFQPHVNAKNDA